MNTPKDDGAPKFHVGDPAHRRGEHIVFIREAKWIQGRGWCYGIEYSQTNMCSLTHWQSGGCSWYWGEAELSAPTGESKLLGELWRELRRQEQLKQELSGSEQRASALRTALEVLKPQPEPTT